MTLQFRAAKSDSTLAIYPSSVVQTGVKSFGCENRTAHESPIHSWKLIGPSVVSAVKSGAMSPSARLMFLLRVQFSGICNFQRSCLHELHDQVRSTSRTDSAAGNRVDRRPPRRFIIVSAAPRPQSGAGQPPGAPGQSADTVILSYWSN